MPNKPTYEELEHRVRILEKSYFEIKRVKEALRNSESLFRNLFEYHATVQLVIDPDSGNILNANNAAATFYGWTREQLQQMRIQDFNTLSLEEIKQEMEKARANQRIHFEFHHRLADGSIRDVEVVSSKIEAKGKDLLHSVIHDITARKQAEKALRESEESFSQLFESAPVPMAYITDVDGYKGTTWNEAWYQTFGYAREQAEGRSGNDIGLWVNPSDRSRFIEIAIQQNYVADFETLLRRRDGSIRDCSLFASSIDKTGHRFLMAVYLDITDRKRLDLELRQSQQHYVMAERLAKIGHWVRNFDSDTAFWSAGIYHIFGIEPTTPAPDQDTFLSMVHPDDHQFIRKGIQRVWDFRKPNRVQYRIIRQDGSLRVVDSLIEPLIAPDGQAAHNLQGTLQDVTEWSAAQDQLRKKEHELREQLVDIERKRTALNVLLEHRENEKHGVCRPFAVQCQAVDLPLSGRIG